jgi:integrase
MTHFQHSLDFNQPAIAAVLASPSQLIAPDVASFADMLHRVQHDASLSVQRRADQRSALRCFARLMGQEPAVMPASPAQYRPRLKVLNPATANLSAKRLANVKADVMHCLRRYGGVPRRNALPSLAPEWQALWAKLGVFEHCQISRFARWCSATGIPPADVDAAVMERFEVALVTESFLRTPEVLVQRTRQIWNKIQNQELGVHLRRLTITPRRDTYVIPATVFPASFQAELDSYCQYLAGADLLAEEGPPKPLRPASIKRMRYQILQLAAGVVYAGPREPTDIASLADLVAPAALKIALGFFLARADNRSTVQISMLADAAVSLARHWLKVDAATLAAIQRLAKKVVVRQVGMTEKNQTRLRQFDDARNLEQLLFYAEDVFTELVANDDGSRDAALQAQTAIAVELLIAAPIRSHNLVALQLDVHLLRSRASNSAVWHLVLPAEQTKNTKRLEFLLSERLVGLLRIYLERYRPRLAPPDNPFLFPSRGGHLATNSLGGRLSKSMFKRTGLTLNLHLFRHLAGRLILTARPGAYGLVEQLLGHRDPTTTRTFYTGMETTAAGQNFDALVQGIRAQLRPERPQ